MAGAAPSGEMRFGTFSLDLDRCALLRGATEVPLRPQAFDMLRYLAESPGRLITKEELIEAIWHNAAVGDDSIVRCVRDIREALGDTDHRLVETVRGRGYRFAAEVQQVPGTPRSFAAVGQARDPAAVRWRSLRISAMWSQPRARRQLLAASALLAVAAAGLGIMLARTTAAPAPHEQAAHYAILGRALIDREHTADAAKQALVLFDKALALDPHSMLALLGYARVMIADVTDGWAPREEHAARLRQAEVAIDRAIALDPKHARAYMLRGFLWRARDNPDRALASFQHALTLEPGYAWARAEAGRTKIELGRAEDAIDDLEAAIRLAPSEPRLPNWYYWIGMAAVHAGKSDFALGWLAKIPRDRPLYYRLATPWLALAHADSGRFDEARALMAEYLSRHPTYSLAGWRRAFPPHTLQAGEQRERIAALLSRLGVPDGETRAGSSH